MMDADLPGYQQLGRDIEEALQNESFGVAYQPKVNLRDRCLQGLEALLRWNCPTRGTVPPTEFLPVAEESGHIVPLGYWVFGEVCRSIKTWEREGLPLVPVSINISARQFEQTDFHTRLSEMIRLHQVDPQMIELELTEGLVMNDIDVVLRRLGRLKGMGLRISIDDFGTGHSCLSHFQRLPIDILKIDQTFVAQIGSSEDSGAIIEAIIALARSLKIDTVAEGVETPEQLEFLIDHGCHVAQGFLFGLPISNAQVMPLLGELRDDTGLHGHLIMQVAGLAGEQ